ncbi:MAG: Na+/Ca+ antiporter, CaCA family [Parcubacteria group bacterium GW2011_GWA2_33_14]|uniref:Sodium:proton exchanger n=1 Tax=Candidatus Staskawiczbacteria bacterium RIFCSPHIGHO2_02_FULL_33_16 TaxID=1802204 RepID=A0A1G2HTI8_9BACT|nr:MAG: Na+/Ca+ antiporter, CaCA family [Parcubacteria group bacterium GW2011_GWA2_33_14]OGZ65842.1 MAG: sodium:proton exchanger [Candidatus Staskawiczbacteria bacterium RIFCSPHIGHO2_02_FULL_33_16]OGZ70498.1 MAG: sodium:proton exchanger [Candidatus Staskawiczbacteria bacterium RIFCSPLOWO2_01_FULL_33_13]
MIITYILFFVGFILLIKGADLLVDGASSLGKRLGISTLMIGLTIVAFGTSTPELIVNIFASIQGNTDIAIGNILGSNIANILLILGISAIIYPLAVKRGTVWKEIPFSLLAAIVVAFMVNDAFIDNDLWSGLTRIDGLILISFFVIFLYYVFGISKADPTSPNEDLTKQTDATPRVYSLWRSYLMIGGGLLGLVIGGKWIVDGSVMIATNLGVSQALIGLTIVAVGTSLPELATSAVAAYKKNVDIAVGNIVGSNIFNIFWILGLSAVVRPLPFPQILMSDVFMTVIATLLLFAVLFVGKRHIIERWQGFCFVVIYIGYIAYLVIRG